MKPLVLFSLLPGLACASWLTLAGHAFRSGQLVGITLPTPADLPSVTSRSKPAGDNARLLPILYVGSELAGDDGPLAVIADASCSVLVLDGSTASGMSKDDVLGSYRLSGCEPTVSGKDALLAPVAIDPSGAKALMVTAQGRVVAVDIKPSSSTFAQALWGPVTIPGALPPSQPLTASPLVSTTSVWIPGPQGNVYRFDLASGAMTVVPAQPCFASAADNVFAPLTQLSGIAGPPNPNGPAPPPNTYVAVTSSGCLFEMAESGAVAWRLQPSSSSYSSTMPVSMPPSVDLASKRVYYTSPDGFFCCATTAGVWPCDGWTQQCVSLEIQSAGATIVGTLAVSPRSDDFHGGQIFVFDSSGAFYAVFAADGVVVTAGSKLINGVSSSPILLPSAMGPGANILVALSRDAVAYTVYVGDENTADDDSVDDDDGVGNDGFSWGVSLQPNPSPSATPSAVPSASAGAIRDARVPPFSSSSSSSSSFLFDTQLAANVSFAVTDDGRIIAPLSDGSVVVVGAKAVPAGGVPLKTIIAVSTTVALLVVLALGLTLWFACRGRCRKRRQQQQQQAEQATQAAAEAALAMDGSSDVDPFLLAGMEVEEGEDASTTLIMASGGGELGGKSNVVYSPPGQWAPPQQFAPAAVAVPQGASINRGF